MKHVVVDSYVLNNDEREIISKATEIINNVSKELSDIPSICIDEQNIEPLIDNLMYSVLNMELKKVYSIFNCLGSDGVDKLKREIAFVE